MRARVWPTQRSLRKNEVLRMQFLWLPIVYIRSVFLYFMEQKRTKKKNGRTHTSDALIFLYVFNENIEWIVWIYMMELWLITHIHTRRTETMSIIQHKATQWYSIVCACDGECMFQYNLLCDIDYALTIQWYGQYFFFSQRTQTWFTSHNELANYS